MFEAAGMVQRSGDAAALLAPIARAPLWQLSDDEVEAGIAAVLAAESALAAACAHVPRRPPPSDG